MQYFLQFVCVYLIIISPVSSTKRVKRIVGGVTSLPPVPDDPVVFTKLYSRNARVEGFRFVFYSKKNLIFKLLLVEMKLNIKFQFSL